MGAIENKRLVQQMFSEGNRGNPEGFLGAMSDDVRWTIIGSTRFSGTYAGKQEIVEKLFGRLQEILESGISLTIDALIADNQHVVTQARGQAKTKDGRAYDNTYCHVIRVADGRVQEVTEYLDTALVDSVLGRR